MNDEHLMDDKEYYESIPIEELGAQGCCKVFCSEYRRLKPEAELWGIKREDGSIAHVYVRINGAAYDINGEINEKDIKKDETEVATRISDAEFHKMGTFCDDEKLLSEVATRRIAGALRENRRKYGIDA